MKTNKNGTYAVELYDVDNTKIATSLYTVSDNNWNRYEFTIPASTNTGQFDNDNGKSMNLGFIVAAGTNYTNGTQYGTFVQGSNLNRAAGLTVNLADSTSNEFYLTGVQMEEGSVATPFEHRSFQDELARCQRYFVKMYGSTGGISTGDGAIATLANFTNTAAYGPIFLPVEMRAAPTPYNPPNYSDLKYYSAGNTFTPSGNQVAFTGAAKNRVELRLNSMTNMTQGNAGWLRIDSSSGYIEFNAEL